MTEPAICGDVILIPWGTEGHVAPFMHLVRKILERGISCTLVLEEQGTESLRRNFTKHGSLENTTGFSVKVVPTFPAKTALENLEKMEVACEPVLQEFLQYRRDGGNGPKCMIVHQFAGWTNRWAKELAVPRYVFSLSAATFAYWMYKYSALIRKDNLLDEAKVREDPILDLPGAPEIRLSESPQGALSVPKTFTSSGDTFDDATGILVNTFYELEASVIDPFHSQLDIARGKQTKGREQSKVLPIGPLAPPKSIGDAAFGRSEKDSKCIQWLDTRSPRSVVYIAFGQLARCALSSAQVFELASALETTKVTFLWIILASSDGIGGSSELADVSKVLPAGFQERTKDYGLVHPFFAPQLQILEHPATGAFLTHCGWNSSLESICRGIPLIGWPRGNDQLLSCRVLEHAGVAARIRPEITGPADILKSAELEKAIRTWMMEGPGRTKLRERALELQHQARDAVAPGGSSYQNFEDLIQKFLPDN